MKLSDGVLHLERATVIALTLLSLAGCETAGPARDDAKSLRQEQLTAEATRPPIVVSLEPLLSEGTARALRSAEVRYMAIVSSGGWPEIPLGAPFRPGEDDRRNQILAQRLAISDDLKMPASGPTSFVNAAVLSEALRAFQRRHGLNDNGVVDARTSRALNVSAEARLTQLRASMRNLQEQITAVRSWTGQYVIVNIPAFYLEAVDGHRVAKRYRVVVGRRERQTPALSAVIKNVNFMPWWHVPDSIAAQDLIPRLQKDPEYLGRERIRVYSDAAMQVEVPPAGIDWGSSQALGFKFKQDPGPWNALGLVRLDMPNEHTVYLHDTPLKDLFASSERAFSAGCVRVGGVFDLAAWILRDTPGWSRTRVDQVVADGSPMDVPLPRPVPVRFVYVSAWASTDGPVEFRDDVYDRDGVNALGLSSLVEGAGSGKRSTVTP